MLWFLVTDYVVFYAGLWSGLSARILMVGTLTALQWFIYDSVKIALAMPPPPSSQYSSDSSPQKDEKEIHNVKA
jgi:hypothetical protein